MNEISELQIRKDVMSLYHNADSLSGVDVHVRTPEGVDIPRDEWLVGFHDLITEAAISRQNGTVRVEAHADEKKRGFELRSRGYTGGDYVDLRQELGVDGKLQYSKVGYEWMLDREASTLTIECSFRTSNPRSYSGESPPF